IDSPWWEEELSLLVPGLGPRLTHLTIPKVSGFAHVERLVTRMRQLGGEAIPLHIPVEEPGRFPDLQRIAEHASVRALEFEIMDFLSASGGVLPATAMRSPEQFEHALVVDAKVQIARAAMFAGKIATHNVTIAARDAAQTRSDA